ncbi:DUF2180 family protein [Streptomyces aculeolatus]
MQCYDCIIHGQSTPAVAVCTECGADVCVNHAWLRSV